VASLYRGTLREDPLMQACGAGVSMDLFKLHLDVSMMGSEQELMG
jgi:hypothetical protein